MWLGSKRLLRLCSKPSEARSLCCAAMWVVQPLLRPSAPVPRIAGAASHIPAKQPGRLSVVLVVTLFMRCLQVSVGRNLYDVRVTSTVLSVKFTNGGRCRAHGSRLQPRVAAGTGFGAPSRRCTDVLLAVNVLCFGAQLLSKNSLMVWGAKVRLHQAARRRPAETPRTPAPRLGQPVLAANPPTCTHD